MKKYSKEFKDSTVQLVINNNESVVKVPTDLDINPTTLYSWVTAYKKKHNLPTRNINLKNTQEESESEEVKQPIKTLNNDFKYSNNKTGQHYENVTIDTLNNNFGSKTNKLDTTITVNVPSLFNINTIFIHLYFYLGLFNILLIIASIINNDFQYFGIILILIFLI